MRQLLFEMAQNVLRLAITMLPALLIIWLIATISAGKIVALNELTTVTKEWPVWLQITTGALLGGLVFTPASNIGNIFWGMVRVQGLRLLGAPEPWEKPYSKRALEFAELRAKTKEG